MGLPREEAAVAARQPPRGEDGGPRVPRAGQGMTEVPKTEADRGEKKT